MNKNVLGFAGSVFSPFRLGARLPASEPLRRPIQHARISMETTKKSGKVKKVAPVVFATDMKGNPVWKLRSARLEDVEVATAIIGKMPQFLVQTFIEDSEMCTMICEGTIKGTKEGEGYKPRVFGVALVDVASKVKDPSVGFASRFVKFAELISAKVHKDMPDAEGVKQKLILGAMKKLKLNGIQSIQTVVRKDSTAYIEELKSLGFGVTSSDGDTVELVANLAALNPDPQKKIE